MMNVKKRGLGKGLSDLGIGELLSDLKGTKNPLEFGVLTDSLQRLPLEYLQPGKYQPRKTMNQEALQELADSIRTQGIIQPIIVRSVAPNRYEIIAGERRWRAAQLAQLQDIPVVIRDISDEAAVAVALIENIQREDLNPIEEALALQRLIDEFDMTHEQVADAIGKARATVTNLLRILQLNDDVKNKIANNELELGHGKVLLPLSDALQSKVAAAISTKKLSVRETETLVRKLQTAKPDLLPDDIDEEADIHIAAMQTKLSEKLGAGVKILHKNGKGKLVVQYHNLSQLEGILERIG